MHPDSYVVLVLRVLGGIVSIEPSEAPVKPADALEWEAASAYHGVRQGIDPFELIAIARNETDFRPELVGPDGKDCGLTQTRVLYSRYRCSELRRSSWIAFKEAARELTENQSRCQRTARGDLARCRINSYNSGVRYARQGWKGRYWLRVTCFADMARAGVRPRGDCRKVGTRLDITRNR
ncbi:MAG: hypothetical protein V2A73_02260 [Pseudomonadota bacterium]